MTTHLRLTALFALVCCALAAQSANAQGDADAGRVLAYTCMGCHGIDGYRNAYPSYRVPRLGGQRAEYIVAALDAYRNGTREHPTMRAQGGSLSDQDIRDLAAYFEGGESAADTVTEDDIRGLDAARACLACHGVGGDAVIPKPPVLSGQHQEYIVHALGQYRSGARSGTVMSAFAAGLTEDDVEAIAMFYSRRQGVVTPDKSE
ncbi:MAG: cytochrome c4 [Gammaproteobacteria bacterium]|nr:cytochrome c4 [Gammaproteobacteria bacterium]MDH5309558.1 cytochrome c4 [Gammaproteobacteria bacterium]